MTLRCFDRSVASTHPGRRVRYSPCCGEHGVSSTVRFVAEEQRGMTVSDWRHGSCLEGHHEAVSTPPAHVEIEAHRTRSIPSAGVRALFDREGWWPDRDERQLARPLELGPAVAGWRGQEVVAFARAVTDGMYRAYVEDVVVRHDHRRHGIGSRLIRALHEEVGGQMIVTAFFHTPLTPFYGRMGYMPTRQVVAHRPADARPVDG